MDFLVFHHINIFISSAKNKELLPEAPKAHRVPRFYLTFNLNFGPRQRFEVLCVQLVEVVEADILVTIISPEDKEVLID